MSIETLLVFAAASAILALTPGPNWLYLISRSVFQGRRAGFVSLAGTTSGLVVHMLAAALGLTVVLATVPLAFDAVRLAGAAYLLWLAWTTLRGAGGGFAARPLPPASDATLFRQALLTGILNPKVALFYLAFLPQFIDPAQGSVLAQSLLLGAVQIAIAVVIDGTLVWVASAVSGWMSARPGWLRAQRLALGSVFGALAVWLALDRR